MSRGHLTIILREREAEWHICTNYLRQSGDTGQGGSQSHVGRHLVGRLCVYVQVLHQDVLDHFHIFLEGGLHRSTSAGRTKLMVANLGGVRLMCSINNFSAILRIPA
jgi:hypothetical protein